MSIYSTQNISDSIKYISKSLIPFLDENINKFNFAFNIIEDKLFISTKLQSLSSVNFRSDLDKKLYSLIIDYAFKSEQMGPNSFSLTLRETLNSLTKRDESFFTDTEIFPQQPTINDLQNIVVNNTTSSSNRCLIESALNLAGFLGNITIEKTQAAQNSVELTNGCTFQVETGFEFKNIQKFINPKIVIIDGYIEGIHEINNLLEEASKDKVPVMLFIRGAAKEVFHTLKINLDRGNLRVFPLISIFDLEGINTLTDISVCTLSDIVSTAQGNLISSQKLSSSPTVDSVVLSQNKITIYNKKSEPFVLNQIKNIKQKRSTKHEEYVVELLNDRIKTLTSNNVLIRLQDDKNFIKFSQEIDYVLRMYKSMISYGITTYENKTMLASTVLASQHFTKECVKLISNLGAVVTIT